MNNRIAFFDFDGTITTKDTLLEFIKFYRGTGSFYTGFLLHSPFLVAYKLRIIPNYVAKQKILRYFFREEGVEAFDAKCKTFSQTVLPGLIRPKAMAEIKRLKAAGAVIVVVSASPENWIADWAGLHGLKLIGTQLETIKGKITGAISGSNCYGIEKVNRIKNRFNLADYDEIYCYGDSAGDRPMLALGRFHFYKPFR